ncbi:MAG: ATP cone domain-containing protein, partial [bacterium]
MSEIARIYPHVPLLETPVQETLPHADGTRIAWAESRRMLFRRIVKDDGSIVDFRRAHLMGSIRSALSKAGHNADYAEELTDRVVIFLANRFEDHLLSTTEVALAAETTLLQCGLTGVADAYAAARGRAPTRVDGSDGNRWPWDRARIVAALRRETGLDLALAEEIAREVEHTIIQARLDSVTASLVRELVNASLLERGLEETRRRHTRLGLPVHDVLKRIAQAKPGRDLPREIGQEVLSQLAMWQMFPSKAADLCREHLLYVHDAGTIHLPRSRRVHLAELIVKGEPPEVTARRIATHRSRVS